MTGTIQQFLNDLGPIFPEMETRLFEVTDIDQISKDTVPLMPLMVGAFIRTLNSNPNNIQLGTVDQSFIIELWYKPERYLKSDGSESPFWAAFDYEPKIDKIIEFTKSWVSPRGATLIFQEANVDAGPMASILSIKFSHKYVWCPPDNTPIGDGLPITNNTIKIINC